MNNPINLTEKAIKKIRELTDKSKKFAAGTFRDDLTTLNSSNNFPTILVAISSSISNIGISFNDTPNNLIFVFLLN